MRKRNVWQSMIVVLVLSMLVVSCTPQQATPPATAQQTEAPTTAGGSGDTILIGGALCLTGIQSPLDEPAVRGAQLAVDLINQKGGVLGRPLEFKNLDGKSDPVTVGNAAIQLIQEGAVAIVTPSDFDFGGPAAREAQKAGLVGISPAASSPLFGSKTLGDLQFPMSMWNTTMGAATAEFVYNTKGWRKGYVVTDTFIDYTKSLSRYFIEGFKLYGGEILFEDTYVQGDQDFSAQLARIKALPELPDFIFISSYMPDLATIIRTLRENGINVPIVGGDSYDDPALFQALGTQYGNDIIYDTHTFLDPADTPGMGDFLAAYQAKYGEAPDSIWVATGFDVVNLLAKAIEIAGTTDGAAVAKAMENNEFQLLTGKLSWLSAADGHQPNKEAVLVELKDGTPVFIGWVRPEKVPPP